MDKSSFPSSLVRMSMWVPVSPLDQVQELRKQSSWTELKSWYGQCLLPNMLVIAPHHCMTISPQLCLLFFSLSLNPTHLLPFYPTLFPSSFSPLLSSPLISSPLISSLPSLLPPFLNSHSFHSSLPSSFLLFFSSLHRSTAVSFTASLAGTVFWDRGLGWRGLLMTPTRMIHSLASPPSPCSTGRES